MRQLPDKYVDLTVTSPPYDSLREYEGYTFDFNNIANELLRITKDGVMKGSGRDRLGIGMNLSYNYNEKLLFKNYLSVESVKSRNSPYGSFSTYVQQNPYYPIVS